MHRIDSLSSWREAVVTRPLSPFLDRLLVNELIQKLDLLVDRNELPASSPVAGITVKTGERFEVPNGSLEEVRIPTVEVWIGGKKFVHDCSSDKEAADMVFSTAIDLGLQR